MASPCCADRDWLCGIHLSHLPLKSELLGAGAWGDHGVGVLFWCFVFLQLVGLCVWFMYYSYAHMSCTQVWEKRSIRPLALGLQLSNLNLNKGFSTKKMLCSLTYLAYWCWVSCILHSAPRSAVHPSIFTTTLSNGTINIWNLATTLDQPVSGTKGIYQLWRPRWPLVIILSGVESPSMVSNGHHMVVVSWDKLQDLSIGEQVWKAKGNEEGREYGVWHSPYPKFC